MIGFLWGLGLLFSYLGQAWGGTNSVEGFVPMVGFFAISAVLGILLFPRTIGMAFTPMFFITPIAFLIALFRHSFSYALAILGAGLLAGLVQFIVGKIRPESAY